MHTQINKAQISHGEAAHSRALQERYAHCLSSHAACADRSLAVRDRIDQMIARDLHADRRALDVVTDHTRMYMRHQQHL